MAYLNLDIDYFTHPKLKRLVRLLGKGSEVLPLKLWAYAAHYFQEDGRLTDLSAEEIESECCWWGEPGKMIQVMIECGWIENSGDAFQIYNWNDKQGHLSVFKERAKVGAKARWDKYRTERDGKNGYASSNASSNASSIASSNAPTIPTIPTIPTKPKEPVPAIADPVCVGESPEADPKVEPPSMFDLFWKNYPRKRRTAKPQCQRFWKKYKLDEIVDKVASGLRAWNRCEMWTKDDGKYICGPHVWLNERRWEDEVEEMPRVNEIGMPILTREEVLEKLGEVESCKVP